MLGAVGRTTRRAYLFNSTLPFSSINNTDSSLLSPFSSPCTSTSVPQLCLPRLPSWSRPYTPCSQFSSQSPFQHLVFSPYHHVICLSCWAPKRSDAPPPCLCCMYFICILYLKPIALYIAPRATPQPIHTWLSVTGMRPLKFTLDRASGLAADPPPAAKANAAYFQCTLVRFLHICFSTSFYCLS